MHSGVHSTSIPLGDKYATIIEPWQIDILVGHYEQGKLNQDNITARNPIEEQELRYRAQRYFAKWGGSLKSAFERNSTN
jgi:hypothetical protein